MPTRVSTAPVVFDGDALIAALDGRRVAQELRWTQLATVLWDQSIELNEVLGDAPLCPGALQRTAKRGTMSCQYALTLLRWLGRPPEDFLVGLAAEVGPVALPEASPSHRLRWDLAAVHAALDDRRRADGLTWAALGAELGVAPSRLTSARRSSPTSTSEGK